MNDVFLVALLVVAHILKPKLYTDHMLSFLSTKNVAKKGQRISCGHRIIVNAKGIVSVYEKKYKRNMALMDSALYIFML